MKIEVYRECDIIFNVSAKMKYDVENSYNFLPLDLISPDDVIHDPQNPW